MLLISEEVVESDEIRMVQESLHFYFPRQLCYRFRVFLLRPALQVQLADHLQRSDEPRPAVPRWDSGYFTR